MSDSRTVAAATMALRSLLLARVPARDPELVDLQITTAAPDQARRGLTSGQLNLFLYELRPNAGWRNTETRTAPRDADGRLRAPLALDLRYLLTAYGRGEGDANAHSHRLLGAALAALHDEAVLDADAVRDALGAASRLPPLIERLRVTPLPFGIEEISKLWSAFQVEYRTSCALEVTVAVIESERPARPAPPVLRRAEDDRGPIAEAGLPPSLDSLRLPDGLPAARLGGRLVAEGRRFGTGDVTAVLTRIDARGEQIDTPSVLTLPARAVPGSDPARDAMAIDLDPALAWHAGFWRVALQSAAAPPATGAPPTSGLPFALAPTVGPPTATVAAGELRVELVAAPRLASGAQALLIMPGRSAQSRSRADDVLALAGGAAVPATRLEFRLPAPPAGSYPVTLRVAEVDSLPYARDPATGAVAFDPAQMVVVP